MLSVLINTHLLMAAEEADVERFFYATSACVYNADKQTRPDVAALKEEDAYPAMPEDGYGWEKLFTERMCRHFREDFGLRHARRALPQRLRPVRHLGRRPRKGAGRDLPQGHPRQVETGKHEIEIWGDGQQTRSFMYIDDCINGINAIIDSDIVEPINLGCDELVTDQPAGRHRRGHRRHQAQAPLQARRAQGRQRPQQRQYHDANIWLGASIRLRDGMERTYSWIREEYLADRTAVLANGHGGHGANSRS